MSYKTIYKREYRFLACPWSFGDGELFDEMTFFVVVSLFVVVAVCLLLFVRSFVRLFVVLCVALAFDCSLVCSFGVRSSVCLLLFIADTQRQTRQLKNR